MIGLLNHVAMNAAAVRLPRPSTAMLTGAAPDRITNLSIPDISCTRRHASSGDEAGAGLYAGAELLMIKNSRISNAVDHPCIVPMAPGGIDSSHDAAPPSHGQELEHAALALYSAVMEQFERGLGAGNKSASAHDEDRRHEAMKKLGAMHAQVRDTGPNAWVYLSKSIPAANCNELSSAVVVRALQNGTNSALLYLGAPSSERSTFDHVAALVAPGGVDLKKLPKTLIFDEPAWRDVLIVDSWAGIVCAPSDYIAQYSSTMRSWNESKMQVMNLDGKLLSPVDPSMQIDGHHKFVDIDQTEWLESGVKVYAGGWRSPFIEKKWSIAS